MFSAEVQTYALDCDVFQNSDFFERCYALMPDYRRKKINSLRFDADKRLSLGAGMLLKTVLGEDGGKEVSFIANGKPKIEGLAVQFNLSHAGKLAILSVGNTPLGCDVEQIKDVNPKLIQRVFTEVEQNYILSAAGEGERKERFYRLWTLKESFLKATGEGLRLPLDSFEFRLNRGDIAISQRFDKRKYSFHEYCIEDYRIAVCAQENASFEEIIRQITLL